MLPRRSVRRDGRGGRRAGRNQPEGQRAVQAVDPSTSVTHANLAIMEQRYKDMLFEALTQRQFAQQTQLTSVQTLVTSV